MSLTFVACPRCDGVGETYSRGDGGYDYASDCFLCERGRTTPERAALFDKAVVQKDRKAMDEIIAMMNGSEKKQS